MASHDEKTRKALHDLIATCNDSAEGYGKAAKGVHDKELSDRLAAIAGERLRFAEELTKLAQASGEEPRNDLHRGRHSALGLGRSGNAHPAQRPPRYHSGLHSRRRRHAQTLRSRARADSREPEHHRAAARLRYARSRVPAKCHRQKAFAGRVSTAHQCPWMLNSTRA